MKNTPIFSPSAPTAAGPYAHAVRSGNHLYTSGQLGVDPLTNALEEGVEAQARRALKNMKAVLETAGFSLEHVVKTTVFLKNMSDFATINAIYAEVFGDNKPARSCIAVAELPRNGLFEIESVSYFEN